jgi:hypothetical protein
MHCRRLFKSELMMNTPQRRRVYPLVMHRWFKRGADWAFHSSLDSSVQRISESLTDQFKERERAGFADNAFKVPYGRGYLIGVHRLDTECQDPLAVQRRPTILAAAVAEGDVSNDYHQLIQAKVELLTFPQNSGPRSDFEVEIVERYFHESPIKVVLMSREARFADAVRIGDIGSARRECLETWKCIGDAGVLELEGFLGLDSALKAEHLIDAGKPTLLFESVCGEDLTLVGHSLASDGGAEVIHDYHWSGDGFQSELKLFKSTARMRRPSKGSPY